MSSGGGLTQLVAYGAQDVALTGEPTQTLWRQKYARHTNYALESIQQTVPGDINYGGSTTITLSRSGDLVCGLVAEVTLTRNNDPYPTSPVEALFQNVELRIGGQQVDYLYSNWFTIYAQLFFNAKQTAAYNDMTNFTFEVAGQQRTFYLPIPFFFSSMNTQLALPMIALQYHDIEVKFNFAQASQIQGVDTTVAPKVKFYADYVFLDSSERVWFAQNPHEYLMTQLQFQSTPTFFSNTAIQRFNVPLNFNHPVKMLAWAYTQPNIHGQFTALQGATDDNTAAPMYSAQLQLNGRDRFTERPGNYFKNANPWLSQNGNYTTSGLYSYHFGIRNTMNNQNSQTLNFSRIDNATLILRNKINNLPYPVVANTATTEQQTYAITGNLTTVEIYALNYNVLRVMSGMGGLAYAN